MAGASLTSQGFRRPDSLPTPNHGMWSRIYERDQHRKCREVVCKLGQDQSSSDNESVKSIEIPFVGEFNLPDLTQITPLKAAKWVTIVAVSWAVISTVAKVSVLNPDMWMYGSWFLVVWPWPVAVALGIWTCITAWKQAKSGARTSEQFLILAGSLVWLILVPLGHFHRFVDGWPILLYFLYFFFFSISSIVRYRLYGTLSTPTEENKWKSSPSLPTQVAFVAAIVAGHWAAAYEGPFLTYVWNWQWKTKLAAAVLSLAIVTHWNAIYFLGKYSDRLVTPMAVVMFGPYRWVRHPIYTSYMLLFAGFCLSLRSYWSLLFIMSACLAYYEQRTRVEEKLMEENFGELYTSYKEKTRHKFLPWVY